MLKAMRTFEVEKEVQSRGCLVLGWKLLPHADVAKKCYEEALACVEAAAWFPEDVPCSPTRTGPRAPSEAEDDRPSTVGLPAKTFSQLGTPGLSSLGTPGKFSQLSTPGRTTPGAQLSSSPGREKLALSPAIDPDIGAYARRLEHARSRARQERRLPRGAGALAIPGVLAVFLGPGAALFFRFGVARLKKIKTSDVLDGAWESHVRAGASHKSSIRAAFHSPSRRAPRLGPVQRRAERQHAAHIDANRRAACARA